MVLDSFDDFKVSIVIKLEGFSPHVGAGADSCVLRVVRVYIMATSLVISIASLNIRFIRH